jgi:hypothetical protein
VAVWHHVPVRAGAPVSDALCSAKGCTTPAAWDLLWNNPKLHTPERRKIWLACDEHRDSLSHFLGSRGFLKDALPHDPEREDPGPTAG